MSRRSRSFESDSGSDSPPRRSRKRRSIGRERSPYSPPRDYRSPREDYYASSSSRSGSYRALCVTNIDSKVSDEAVKDALYKEFRRFGEVSVKVAHEPDERVAYISYKSSEDARYAKKNKPRIMFYDKPIQVSPVYEPDPYSRRRSPSGGTSRDHSRRALPPPVDHRGRYSPAPPPHLPYPDDRYPPDPYLYPPPAGYPMDMPSYDPMMPLPPGALPPHMGRRYLPGAGRGRFMEFPHPGAERGRGRGNRKDRFPNYLQHIPPEDDPLSCRTLFAGNLEVSVPDDEVRRIFARYGTLEDVDIKRPPPDSGNAYAFIRYENLDMAHQAKISLSGQYVGKFMCKIGYGKPVPTVKIWIGGLGESCTREMLEKEFDRFGAIKSIGYENGQQSANITFDSIDAAKAAVSEMRGFAMGGPTHRLRIDFAHVPGQSDPGKPPPPTSGGSPGRLPPPPPGEDSFDDFPPVRPSGRGFPASRGRGYLPHPPHHVAPIGYDPYDPLAPPGMPRRPLPPPDFDQGRGYRPGRSPPPYGGRYSPPGQHRVGAGYPPRSPPPIGHRDRAGRVDDIRVVSEVEHIVPVSWEGGIILKNSIFATKLHMVRGDRSSVQLLGSVLKIAQRLRLDASKLDDVQRRLSVSPAHAIFIGLPTMNPAPPPPPEDASVQDRPLKQLVGYLKQKDAAGVISLQSNKGMQTGVVYAFPPCHFSFELLRVSSPNIIEDDMKEDHVVIVMVTGGI